MADPTLVLHDYWRSGAAYRVRIALNLKGLVYTPTAHDLRVGAHQSAEYTALAPQGLVPALCQGPMTFTQSLAIIEWLDERYPLRPLLPREPTARAIVRAMASLIACDIHPLHNLRVLNALKDQFDATPSQLQRWIETWMVAGLVALEALVEQHGGACAYGDTPTLADCCLVPQMYSARRFGVDLARFPRLVQVDQAACEHPGFAAAAPDRQADADVAVSRAAD